MAGATDGCGFNLYPPPERPRQAVGRRKKSLPRGYVPSKAVCNLFVGEAGYGRERKTTVRPARRLTLWRGTGSGGSRRHKGLHIRMTDVLPACTLRRKRRGYARELFDLAQNARGVLPHRSLYERSDVFEVGRARHEQQQN